MRKRKTLDIEWTKEISKDEREIVIDRIIDIWCDAIIKNLEKSVDTE